MSATTNRDVLLKKFEECKVALFERYDLDSSGTLNTQVEFQQVLTNLLVKLEITMRPEELEELVQKAFAEDDPWSLERFSTWFTTEVLVALKCPGAVDATPEGSPEATASATVAEPVGVETIGVQQQSPSEPGTGALKDPEEDLVETPRCWQPNPLLMFLFIIVVILPLVVIVLGFLFGGILAGCESWTWMTGFYYVISILCGLPTPMTDASPDSGFGIFADIVVSVWALSVAGTFIGIVAGMGLIGRLTEWLETAGNIDELTVVDAEALMEALRSQDHLDFTGFRTILRDLGSKAPTAHLKKLFDKFDIDGSGDLDREEVDAIGDVLEKARNGELNDKEWTTGATTYADSWQVIQNQKVMQEEIADLNKQMRDMQEMIQQIHCTVCQPQS